MVDYLRVSGSMDNRVIEYVDHLHEHFVHPVVMRGGRYMPPAAPGYSATMYPASLEAHTYPTGSVWAAPVGAAR
jgi:L-fuconate dehydratase